LIVNPGDLRDVGTLAERLSALKEQVRRHGGAVHAMAHLDTITEPAWRPLNLAYVSVAGHVASMLGK